MKARFTPNDINLIPEVEADWAGMNRVILRINFVLVVVIACLIIDLIIKQIG